ncbi:MAG: hypothetical protein RDO_0060 [Flavobacteriales endosymbiont of Rhyzopertha dominica]|nr:MAG: HemK family protein methyltransferase [Candidatus Shikimatogenerans bostrichidophilus]
MIKNNITINNCYKKIIIILNKIYNKKEIYKLFFIIFKNIFKCNNNKIYYYLLINKKINIKKYNIFINNIIKLKKKIPIQYIIKYTYFLNIKIYLNKRIFIPRQETEELTNLIIKENKNKNKKLNILDICSGSGCISISIKKNIYNCNIYCIENNKKILYKSKKNFFYNKIFNNIYFYKFNILNNKKRYKKFFKKLPLFDIIISNPPYVSYKEYYKYINKNIIYEPYNSIFVNNNDEILFYKKILLNFYKKKLKNNGIIYFEISNNIKNKILLFLKKKINNKIFNFKKDINNNYRILKIIKKK